MKASLRSFNMLLRFVLPPALVFALFAYAVIPLVDNISLRWASRDLDVLTEALGRNLQGPLSTYVPEKAQGKISELLDRTVKDEGLFALAFCDARGMLLAKTESYPQQLGCKPTASPRRSPSDVPTPQGRLLVSASPVVADGQVLGSLRVIPDTNSIDSRSADAKKYLISLFALMAVVISLITGLVAHWSWRGWISAVRSFLRVDRVQPAQEAGPPEIQPLMGDLRALLHEIDAERGMREDTIMTWTPDTLRLLLREQLADDQVLVVSNREPYIHLRTSKGVEIRRPASGLVTAVEPVMRACSGTWIAHGSGSADRENADRHGRVPVPPGQPTYTLRRVWLSREEENGYYYGFANEGLWPLCHIAHVRPVFRASDWQQYLLVNRRFAEAVVEEARTDDPVVLVQDYHFALLPRLIRDALPKATIISFWHIPWPNPESFGICPWRDELLEGLLGSTILGFHTRFHRQNFMDTVDRYLEARIEHETSTISFGGKLTQVKHYPISIHWPDCVETERSGEPGPHDAVRAELGMTPDHLLAVGVERLDYTKGVLERFNAVEHMLERHPELVGRFALLQIAAPSRSSLDEYQSFEARTRSLAQRINQRFADGAYPPIVLKMEYHEPAQIDRYYRAADVCVVTSLHDGMNLVAKEFIAARDDELGVLVLSQFTGAANELHDALVINPYHVEQCANALYRGLTMPLMEQRDRMRSMRSLVKDFNVYRWAGRMLLDAARLRQRERTSAKIRSYSRAPLRRVV